MKHINSIVYSGTNNTRGILEEYLHCELYNGVLRVVVLNSLPRDVLLAVKAVPVAVKILKNTKETGVCIATRSQVRTRKIVVEADELAQDNIRLSPVERSSVNTLETDIADISLS